MLSDDDSEDIGKYAYNVGKLMVKLLWVILDAGSKPEFNHDTIREKVAYAILVIYAVIAILILLNLTVTLMNATIQKFENR